MDKIEIKVTAEDPKPNAQRYRIDTFQDMLNAVNGSNVDKFLKEFEIIFRSMVLTKELYNMDKKDSDPGLQVTGFDWIDD